MTNSEFKQELERLGINLAQAARLINVHHTTARKYAAGMLPVPGSVAQLISMITKDQASEILAGERVIYGE